MATALWWIRRDLRLTDNQALSTALDAAGRVVPVFILDPRLLSSTYVGVKRTDFLFAGLRVLDEQLRLLGSYLVVREGKPAVVLDRLLRETGAERIFAEADHSPYACRRDAAVGAKLPLSLTGGVTALPIGDVGKEDGEAYTMFTPFSRKWKAVWASRRPIPLNAPAAIATPADIPSQRIPERPDLPADTWFMAGEAEAQRRLTAFCANEHGIYRYAMLRNRPDLQATSCLSPYLRFGMLSARQAAFQAASAMSTGPDSDSCASAEVWLNELIWREFYIGILRRFPHVRGASFRPEYDHIAWLNDPDHFDAWCLGRTGYPFVDAAMRAMVATGWLHNRARMVVASFLVKDLLIDWRWGERWFMQHLIDGDPAANNGGWQWTAGTGTDAAPYFRVFNPVTQSVQCDPEGIYIRAWIPELNSVPVRYLHAPWTMPLPTQRAAGCLIGQDYPLPIVDHGLARRRALAAYQAVRP